MKQDKILDLILAIPRVLLGIVFCLFIYGTIECLTDPIRVLEYSGATIGLLIAVAGLVFVVKYDGNI